jgi:hypothetical protein
MDSTKSFAMTFAPPVSPTSSAGQQRAERDELRSSDKRAAPDSEREASAQENVPDSQAA